MGARALRLLPLRALSERWTVTALLAALYGALACTAALSRVADPDVWWLAAAGRDILASGRVPQVNGYGFTAPAHPWVMHEWLYGVVLAVGAGRSGPGFFTLVGMGCGTACLASAIAFTTARAPRAAAVPLALLAAAPVQWMLFSPRPSSLAVAFALAMALLAFRPGWSLTRTALVVALESLWTQMHGSFPLGLVILTAALAEVFADRVTRRLRLGGIVLAGLVTFVNPYGARLHGLVQHYALGDDPVAGAIHEHIAEFQPLWRAGPIWASPPSLVALVIVVGLAVSALAHRRHAPRALFVLGLATMAAAQARHLPLAVMVGATVLVCEIEALLPGGPAEGAPLRALPLLVGALAPGLVLSASLCLVVQGSRTRSDQVAESLGGPWVQSLGDALPDRARVYAPYGASAVLLWEQAPRGVQVFFDPRNDCYPPDVFLAAIDAETDPAADRLLLVRGTDEAIVPISSSLGDVLAHSALWSPVQSAGPWRLFRRTTMSLQ